jgi:mono/diheme cytochrome c family protein
VPTYLLATLLLCPSTQAAPDEAFTAAVQVFPRANCIGCHNDKLTSGGLNLAQFLAATESAALQDRAHWQNGLGDLDRTASPAAHSRPA